MSSVDDVPPRGSYLIPPSYHSEEDYPNSPSKFEDVKVLGTGNPIIVVQFRKASPDYSYPTETGSDGSPLLPPGSIQYEHLLESLLRDFVCLFLRHAPFTFATCMAPPNQCRPSSE